MVRNPKHVPRVAFLDMEPWQPASGGQPELITWVAATSPVHVADVLQHLCKDSCVKCGCFGVRIVFAGARVQAG